MQTLQEFYEFMDGVHTVRRAVVSYYLMRAHNQQHIRSLEHAIHAIDELPGGRLEKRLIAGEQEVTVTLDYERGELEKDVYFLGHDEPEFFAWLADRTGGSSFAEEVESTVDFLRGLDVENLITDRDGTVNNYCGRYRSSHQSVWNAAYLTRVVRSVPGETVILTSAPLMNAGLLKLSAMPAGSTHYAGSKGREYHRRDGAKGAMELDADQKTALERLNGGLRELLSRQEFRSFALIGSGLQYKFGETTVARQDIHGSIPHDVSRRFLQEVRELVADLDPHGSTFGVDDTGKDVEITLTTSGNQEFTKGEGVGFLDEELGLDLATGPNLICGDTASDLPMVREAVSRSGPDRTATVFVTTDADLQRDVSAACSRAHVVSTPDVLVCALHRWRAAR